MAGLVVGLIVSAALTYLILPILFEDAETNIACVSALAMRGAPVYPAMDATARYSLAYGPLTYLTHLPVYWAFGESLVTFKLVGVVAFLVTLLLCYRLCRRFASSRDALVGLGCISLVFFRYLHVEYWGRNDPLLLCFTALALWAIVDTKGITSVAIAGLSFAALPNLKITAVFYILPILVLFVVQRGWKLAAAAVALTTVLFPLPFLLPQVPLAGYIEILRAVGRHGLSASFLVRNLQYAAVSLLPLAMLARSGKKPHLSLGQIWYLGAIVVGLLGACLAGAKIGAGSYHLLPMALPLLYGYFWIRSERQPATRDQAFRVLSIAWVLTMLFYSANFVNAVWHAYRFASPGRSAVAEIRLDEERYYGSTLQVGIGDDFRDARTFYGYEPVFHGQPYLISGASMRDIQFGGVNLPDKTLADLRRCGTRIWLIPAGQRPFTAPNTYYPDDHPAFGEGFTSTFAANYRKARSGAMYDVWICTH